MTEPIFRLRAYVSLVGTDDGAVLLDEKSGRYWQINTTGYLILQTLMRGGTPDEAARLLADTYEVNAQRAADDVTTLVELLSTTRLVERA